MHLLQFIAVLVCLTLNHGVLSAPTERNARSFKVDRVRRNDYLAHGPTALRNAYRKFGIVPTMWGIDRDDFEPVDPRVLNTGTRQDVTQPERTGAVSATSTQSDAEFISPVTIGGQTIDMVFDTGSSDLWVMSTNTPNVANKGHTLFDPSKSSTFKLMDGASFKIRYGDGSHAAGNVGTDTVNIGGAVVKKQAVEIPTVLSDSLAQDPAMNGLVGLGFKSISTVEPEKQPTFFENVAADLADPVMTARLKSDGVGEYEFGTIDKNKYSGQMFTFPVDNSNGFWQFDSQMFRIGGGRLQGIRKVPTAIADTGTSLLLADPDVVGAYYAQVDGAEFENLAGGFIYPCKSALPDLSINAGNAMVRLQPEVLTFAMAGRNRTTGDALCFGGLQSNQGSGVQIFGDVFLKSLFVVFDLKGPSIGLASQA